MRNPQRSLWFFMVFLFLSFMFIMKDPEQRFKGFKYVKVAHDAGLFSKRLWPAYIGAALSVFGIYHVGLNFSESKERLKQQEISKTLLTQKDIDYYREHFPNVSEADMKRMVYQARQLAPSSKDKK